MTDQIDAAQDHIEKELEQRIAEARRPRKLAPVGECLNCGDPIQIGRYCCKECAEDDEARIRHLRRNGML